MVGLAQGLVVDLGIVLGLGLGLCWICLGRRGKGEGEDSFLEKKEVIWLC